MGLNGVMVGVVGCPGSVPFRVFILKFSYLLSDLNRDMIFNPIFYVASL
jgi:hypothetical protein